MAAMLDIPELDDMVCGLLTRHDLAQCARVSKKWNSIAIPHLWRDLSCINTPSIQQVIFKTLVLEDYLQELQRQELQKEFDGIEWLPQSCRPLPDMAKYAPSVHMLPDPEQLSLPQGPMDQTGLRAREYWKRYERLAGYCEGQYREVQLHLLSRFGSAKVPLYDLGFHPRRLDYLGQAITESILPRVCHLTIQEKCDVPGLFHKLQSLLDQCSTALEKLTIEIDYEVWTCGILDFRNPSEAPEPREWSSLKDLTLELRGCSGAPQPSNFWSWLFQRCGRVENLEVSNTRQAHDLSIAEAALTHMPNLINITLGHNCDDENDNPITDKGVAALLSVSRKGWKTVRLKETSMFSNLSMEVLKQHLTTLEVFEVNTHEAYPSPKEHLMQVLSSFPNLHTFAVNDQRVGFGDINGRLPLNEFIGKDPERGLLRTWACESSLKVLKVRISDIPRPVIVDNNDGIQESYPGQGREIQGLVYDRLARLTNLEILWLGQRYGNTEEVGSLEMSLESGLEKLSGLKKLKGLNVVGRAVKIGVKEVQWMVKHWPRLRMIAGFEDYNHSGEEVAQWLEEHYPGISLSLSFWPEQWD